MFAEKTIAFIEFRGNGHHPVYLKWFSKIALEMGHRVIVCCPYPDEVETWIRSQYGAASAERFTACRLDMPAHRFSSKLDVVTRWFRVSRILTEATQRNSAALDLVFFNHLEDFILASPLHRLTSLLITYPWAGLFLQPWRRLVSGQAADSRNDAGKYALFGLHACRGMALLDETAYDKLAVWIPKEKLSLAPDFAETALPEIESGTVGEIRNRAQGRLRIGLFGFMKKYKGILTLIEAARRADPAHFFFVFAGELVPEGFSPEEYSGIVAFAKQGPPNCFFRFEHISGEAEYNAMINGVDVVFAAFENFPHSSNTLAKAAAFKKPVIVSKGYCMQKRVDTYRLGEVVDEGNAVQCLEAFSRIRRELDTYVRNAKFAEYLSVHSAIRLKPLFQKMLAG